MREILVIHPDLVARENLVFVLQHAGFRAVGVAEGQQALAEINRSCPDLIVKPAGLHGLNGNELCILIREVSQAPIVILGNDKEEASAVDLLEMGADAYLLPPLNLRELLARVRSLLRRTKASQGI